MNNPSKNLAKKMVKDRKKIENKVLFSSVDRTGKKLFHRKIYRVDIGTGQDTIKFICFDVIFFSWNQI